MLYVAGRFFPVRALRSGLPGSGRLSAIVSPPPLADDQHTYRRRSIKRWHAVSIRSSATQEALRASMLGRIDALGLPVDITEDE